MLSSLRLLFDCGRTRDARFILSDKEFYLRIEQLIRLINARLISEAVIKVIAIIFVGGELSFDCEDSQN